MTAAPQDRALSLALAAAVAAACAVGLGLSLSAVATPPGYAERLAALERRADSVSRVLRARSDPRAFPADAICRATPDQALALVRRTITAQADAAKLVISDLSIGPDSQAALGETLVPYRISLHAQGAYDASLSLLATLARSRPMVFVDTADLTSNTTSVTLKLSGRFYCSAAT